MIAVLCAMKEERDAFLNRMEDVREMKSEQIHYHGEMLDNEYYVGKIANKDVVLGRCGVGEIYATINTLLMIQKFDPELMINCGVAGSLDKNIHVGDIVVANRAADWRMDVPGWDRNIDSVHFSFACDERVLEIVSNMRNVFIGPIVSANEFIYEKNQLQTIKKFFPEALAGEMEGAAVANTCYAFGKKCSIIRSISDETLVQGNFKQFDFNLQDNCKKVAALCKEIIARY